MKKVKNIKKEANWGEEDDENDGDDDDGCS